MKAVFQGWSAPLVAFKAAAEGALHRLAQVMDVPAVRRHGSSAEGLSPPEIQTALEMLARSRSWWPHEQVS